jgi:hypothetical protein
MNHELKKKPYVNSCKFKCELFQNADGYYTQCGFRLAFNKNMKYCPYCGRPLVKYFIKD